MAVCWGPEVSVTKTGVPWWNTPSVPIVEAGCRLPGVPVCRMSSERYWCRVSRRGFLGTEKARMTLESRGRPGWSHSSMLQDSPPFEPRGGNEPELHNVERPDRRTPFSLGSQVTPLRGPRKGKSPASRIPHRTRRQSAAATRARVCNRCGPMTAQLHKPRCPNR